MSRALPSSWWSGEVDRRCDEVAANGAWRKPKSFDSSGNTGLLETLPPGTVQRGVVAFASNDYLGLTTHPEVLAAAHLALDRWGAGSGASRLVTGSRPVHHELEAELAEWKGQERSILFPTGFQANLGVLATFGARDVMVCSDELNHASIVDGARLSRAEVAIFAHRDVDHLAKLLAEADGRPTIVVTDHVFSMDGDIAPVSEMADLCRLSGSLLVLDEAHSVLGPDPSPLLEGVDVLRVGTLSKALGSLGGFVAGPRRFVELLENKARSYIFTTALPPAVASTALASLRVVRSPEGTELVRRLRAHTDRVAPGHPSPIVPVVLGSAQRAIAASEQLLEAGLWVPAIRPPSVPEGTARLRVTLSASHTDEEVEKLVDSLRPLRAETLL
jgi:8-amino-7-oxononanoate synthase